ncbi:ImmA/IrrE family metallo-endopeptidase [bacterium SCSIO 12827]|nr:ImmA/IrrE family metallo-endopeptidase [bacterium SCSIO 12827]
MIIGVGEYTPNYAVPPGWILEERLELREWSQAEFARRCGRSAKLISEIIAGKAPIEPDTALEFEKVLDLDANVWLNLEANYQLQLAREREREKLQKAREWYRKFAIPDLVKAGLFEPPTDEIDGTKKLLRFFGVGSLKGWEEKIGAHVALARHTPVFKSSKEAVSVWLRLGEKEATLQECQTYNEGRFKDALSEIRLLTRSQPSDFHPRMTYLCNNAGVAYAPIPPLPGNRLSGAAWWLNRRTPVIQLTLRGKSNDIFWFTFFHEAAHILLHSKKDTFIDEDKRDGTACEAEADAWARDFLIPPQDWGDFIARGIFTKTEICNFAFEQGIAPAIVLGRLQFEKRVRWNSPLNTTIKQSYEIV